MVSNYHIKYSTLVVHCKESMILSHIINHFQICLQITYNFLGGVTEIDFSFVKVFTKQVLFY